MALVYELIRLRRHTLYLFGHSPGGDRDVLIGAGCVKRVELAYEADEAFNTDVPGELPSGTRGVGGGRRYRFPVAHRRRNRDSVTDD
jgi:hypothetical protein